VSEIIYTLIENSLCFRQSGFLLRKCDLKSLCLFFIDIKIAFDIHGFFINLLLLYGIFRIGACLSVIFCSILANLFMLLFTSSQAKQLIFSSLMSSRNKSSLKLVKSLKYRVSKLRPFLLQCRKLANGQLCRLRIYLI
jgi:hypothetical protein